MKIKVKHVSPLSHALVYFTIGSQYNPCLKSISIQVFSDVQGVLSSDIVENKATVAACCVSHEKVLGCLPIYIYADASMFHAENPKLLRLVV